MEIGRGDAIVHCFDVLPVCIECFAQWRGANDWYGWGLFGCVVDARPFIVRLPKLA